MSADTGHTDHIPGTTVFTGQRSRQGLRLNRFAYSLHEAGNREAFQADPADYMAKYGLSDWEQQKIAARDWKTLVEEGGGSIYMLLKLGGVLGEGLTQLGAQQRGETQEEFMKTRNVPLRQNK